METQRSINFRYPSNLKLELMKDLIITIWNNPTQKNEIEGHLISKCITNRIGLSKKSVDIAEGFQSRKSISWNPNCLLPTPIKPVHKEDTGTSIKNRRSNSSYKANPKKTAAINLPNNPRFANPVGRAMNKSQQLIHSTSFKPKLITTRECNQPAINPQQYPKLHSQSFFRKMIFTI